MDRRDFLKQSGAAALAATASGPFVHASDKAGSDHPVIGKGEYRYRVLPQLGRGAEHDPMARDPRRGDRQGGLHLHQASGRRPHPEARRESPGHDRRLRPGGKFVRSFGKEYHGGGHGIDIREEDGQEFLYLSCMMPVRLVVKTDLKGEVVWIKKAPQEPHVYDKPNMPFAPTNVAFAPDGGFYVSDGYGSHYIHEYDKDARWVRTFGGAGDRPGPVPDAARALAR